MVSNPVIKGFSLVEMLLSVALIGVITAISIPVYRGMFVKNDLDSAAIIVTQTLRRAQALSTASDGDNQWGVKVQTGSITLFKGTSYALRLAGFDEVYEASSSIAISGSISGGEVVFAKFTGEPQSTGTIILTSESESKTVTINAKGMVSL